VLQNSRQLPRGRTPRERHAPAPAASPALPCLVGPWGGLLWCLVMQGAEHSAASKAAAEDGRLAGRGPRACGQSLPGGVVRKAAKRALHLQYCTLAQDAEHTQ